MKNIKIFGLILFSSLAFMNLATAQKVSDKELKLNVEKINNAQQLIANLDPIVFDYNQEQFKKLDLPGGKQFGFLLNDAKEIAPELVSSHSKVVEVSKNTSKAVQYDDIDYNAVVALLVSAVKEQQQEIEKLKAEVKQLKRK